MNCNNNLKGRFPAEGKERDLLLQRAPIPPALELSLEKQIPGIEKSSTASHMLSRSLDVPAGPLGRQEQGKSFLGGGAFISVAPYEPLLAGPDHLPLDTTASEYVRQLSKRRNKRRMEGRKR